jgi:hypothetical protein
MARLSSLNFDGNVLKFTRSGTFLEKTLSLIVFFLGLGILLLNATGQWSDFTGFRQHWSGLALAIYCMLSPSWPFMEHIVVIDRLSPMIDRATGWSVLLFHRKIRRNQATSLSVITHDQSGFFKTDKLAHSIVVFGGDAPLFLHRTTDYQRALQIGRKLAVWMKIKFNDDRKVQWRPFSGIYYYNSGAMVILCALALWDWMS